MNINNTKIKQRTGQCQIKFGGKIFGVTNYMIPVKLKESDRHILFDYLQPNTVCDGHHKQTQFYKLKNKQVKY